MTTTMKTYLEASGRTAATKLHGQTIRQSDLVSIVEECTSALRRLDQVKKALFYGREPSWGVPKNNPEPVEADDQLRDLLHGILGVATEAGELLELLLDPTKLTKEKLIDESGDILWYLALLFRRLGVTFEYVGDGNIRKLAIRFPDKFEEFLAANKDDEKEKVAFKKKP